MYKNVTDKDGSHATVITDHYSEKCSTKCGSQEQLFQAILPPLNFTHTPISFRTCKLVK